jgi:hypothetical protein
MGTAVGSTVDDVLLAVVVRPGHVPFSKRAAPQVALLSGALEPGDEVEVLGADGVVTPARVHSLGGDRDSSGEDRVVSLDGIGPHAVARGDVLRRAGEPDLGLPGTGPLAASRARLLEAVRWVRAGAVAGPDTEVLRLLPDEGVVLFVEHRLRRALGRHTSALALQRDFEAAADAFETIGLGVDADRLRIAAAAALEGHGVAPSSTALTEAAALGALAVSDAAESMVKHGRGIGAALDLDVLEGLAAGVAGASGAAGEQLRHTLQAQGRAVALGWCPRCHDAVPLDARLRCVDDGKKVRDVVLVVPEDLPLTQSWLRSRARSHR